MIYLWAFVFLIVYIYIRYSDPLKVIDKMFPGPFRVPIFDNALSFVRGIQHLYRLPKDYGYKSFRLWILNKPYILVPDYKTAKLILTSSSCLDKPDEYSFLDPWLGDQFVFTGPEHVWRKGRKFITPAFNFQILKQYFSVFDDNSRVLVEKLKKHNGKESFDISKYSTLCSLDNICAAVMGVNFKTQDDPESEYVKAVKNIITVAYNRVFLVWLRSDTIFKISSTGRLQDKCLKILHENSNEVIQERKRKIQKIENADNSNHTKAFLDTVLETYQAAGYNDKELRQAVDAIMFGGHDTVSAALGFLFYALAKHQDVQEKVFQEIEEIFQDSDRCPTFEDLQQMKYTEQTIKETLRMYTITPFIGRIPKEDFYINEKQFIPKNTVIGIFLGAIHKDPEIWPNPDKFDPERFSPEAIKNRDPYTFLAFSAGHKSCLGVKFAMFEMKITLSRILRNVKLSLSGNREDKIKIYPYFIMCSKNGIRVKLESRDLNNNAKIDNKD